MLLRFPKNLIQPGLFIEAVDCPSSEFSRRRFMLESAADLDAIMASSAVDIVVSQTKSRVDVDSLMQRAPSRYRQAHLPGGPLNAETITAIEDAMQAMRESISQAISGGIDMEKAGIAAATARSSIEAAPDLFIEVSRLKKKDEGTFMHSITVAGLMSRMAELMGMDEALVDDIGKAGILHDVGKLLIPNAILRKSGKPTTAEWRILRSHPVLGYQRLKEIGNVSDLVLDVCRFHHEALDGSGYPLGLKQDEISIAVRICSVCDVFDALTSVRPYKKAWSTRDAVNWMYDRDHLFDRKLVLRLGSIFG